MSEMKQDDEMNAQAGGAGSPEAQAFPGDPVTQGLRKMFIEYLEEPIPDEFLVLFDRIDEAAAKDSDPGTKA